MKGKDFTRKEAQKLAAEAFHAVQGDPLAQNYSSFIGTISLDRSTITDNSTGKVYNLSFTGNPGTIAQAFKISDSEAIVIGSDLKLFTIDANSNYKFFAIEKVLSDFDEFGNNQYNLISFSSGVLQRLPLSTDGLTVTHSFTFNGEFDPDLDNTHNTFTNGASLSQDGKHLMLWKIGKVVTAESTVPFNTSILITNSDTCTDPSDPSITFECVTGYTIGTESSFTSGTESFDIFFSFKLFKNFSIKKDSNGNISFSSDIPLLSINTPIGSSEDAIGIVANDLSYDNGPPDPFGDPSMGGLPANYASIGTTSSSLKNITYTSVDFNIADNVVKAFITGVSTVSFSSTEVYAREVDHFSSDPSSADYLYTGGCDGSSCAPISGPFSPFGGYRLPDGLFQGPLGFGGASVQNISYATAIRKFNFNLNTNLIETALSLHTPPSISIDDPDNTISVLAGDNLGSAYGFSHNGFIKNDDYFAPIYNLTNVRKSSSGSDRESFYVIGIVSYSNGLLLQKEQNWDGTAVSEAPELYTLNDDTQLYLGFQKAAPYTQIRFQNRQTIPSFLYSGSQLNTYLYRLNSQNAYIEKPKFENSSTYDTNAEILVDIAMRKV